MLGFPDSRPRSTSSNSCSAVAARLARPAPGGVSMDRWPVSRVYRAAHPLGVCRFAVLVVSGTTLLTTAFHTSAYRIRNFRVKLMACSSLDHSLVYHTNSTSDRILGSIAGARRPPRGWRRISNLAGTTVILAGRMNVVYALTSRRFRRRSGARGLGLRAEA